MFFAHFDKVEMDLYQFIKSIEHWIMILVQVFNHMTFKTAKVLKAFATCTFQSTLDRASVVIGVWP